MWKDTDERFELAALSKPTRCERTCYRKWYFAIYSQSDRHKIIQPLPFHEQEFTAARKYEGYENKSCSAHS